MLNGVGATYLSGELNVEYYDAVVNQQKKLSLCIVNHWKE